jgi:Ser/Thr protein kinase RdoA (MazF antagonist)
VVTHRHNHTGANKLSFEVRAGGEHLWVKVAANDKEETRLKAWASVATVLAERHAAPPVLDVLGVAGRTALVFPFLDVPVATPNTLRERYGEVKSILAGLHGDGALAELLGPPTTSAASFRDVWVTRFEADLNIIAGHVAPATHDYLAAEVEAFARLVDSLDLQVSSAIHGDPWHENVLAGADRVWLLDWEHICVGDPVVDEAILLMHTHGPHPAAWPWGARYQIARRALMLDAAVDSAADWVQSADPDIRELKEQQYLEGLAAYRATGT